MIDTNSLLKEVKEEVKDIIPFSNRIINNVKLINSKRVLGRCQRCIGGTYYTIYLSTNLIKTLNKKLIKETLIHELIHTCDKCFNHGYLFKYYMNKVNSELGYNVVVRSNNQEFREQASSQFKYKITCKKCGKVFYRDRMPRNCISIKHSCGGDIIVEKLR